MFIQSEAYLPLTSIFNLFLHNLHSRHALKWPSIQVAVHSSSSTHGKVGRTLSGSILKGKHSHTPSCRSAIAASNQSAESDHSGVVGGVMNAIQHLFNVGSRVFLEDVPNGVGEALTKDRDCLPGDVHACASFLL